MKKLKLIEIKNSILHDARFRALFPEMEQEFQEVIKNPSCGCNMPVYRKVLEFKDRLVKYFPNREIVTPKEEVEALGPNQWSVINCKANELESVLNNLHKFGRKQIAVARWEDQITVVVNDLGVVF